ncbi:MAG TPA: calcium-binding protein, partial [Hyphomicrobiales bacterium]
SNADSMTGGTGNDRFVVRDAGDTANEGFGQGIDQVLSFRPTFTLGPNVENLTLLGLALNGFGNSLNNLIVGNGRNNLLSGLGGDDRIFGQGGNDSLFGGSGNDALDGGTGNDRADGGSGNDRLFGRSGNDTLLGNTGNDALDGGDGNDLLLGGSGTDTLFGGTGNDILIGGSGGDTLVGGTGADHFRFIFASDSPPSLSPFPTEDKILDFTRAQGDRIDLRQVDADDTVGGNQDFAFIGLLGPGTPGKGQLGFNFGPGGETVVMGNTDNDAAVEIEFRVTGPAAPGTVIGDYLGVFAGPIII